MALHLASTSNPPAPYSDQDRQVISLVSSNDVLALMSQCPAYQPTPLHFLPEFARSLDIDTLMYKDESHRFGLNAFKALGGAYAVGVVLLKCLKNQKNIDADFKTLAEGGYKDEVAEITVTCASAGNHGRAVAAGARHFGCRAVIYLPDDAAPEREQMIRDTGADVARFAGTYDDTLVEVDRQATKNGWVVISDTAKPGFEDIPQTVMQGYTVTIAEVIDQLAAQGKPLPTHVFIQGGVGGIAAAIGGYLADRFGPDRPMLIVVEPEESDCLFTSSQQGEISAAKGSLDTFIGPLNCRLPSTVAWSILSNHADAFVTISDDLALETIERLKHPKSPDPVIHAGPAGCASTAGLCHTAMAEDMRDQLGLTSQSRVLVFGTEGAIA
jgi:diaminopropionate ammonia-lyase